MSAVDAETKKKSPPKDTPKATAAVEKAQNGGGPPKELTTTTTTTTPVKNGQATPTKSSPPSNLGKSMNVLRERSFIRPTNPHTQMMHPVNAAIFMDPMHQKRRSFGHQVVNFPMGPPPHMQNPINASAMHHHPHHQQQQQQQQHQQLRGKPELEIYRPPSTSPLISHSIRGAGARRLD